MDKKEMLNNLWYDLEKLECDLRKENEKLYNTYMRAEEYRHAIEDMLEQIEKEMEELQ